MKLIIGLLYNAMTVLRFHYENQVKHAVVQDEVRECFSDPRHIVRRIGSIYWLVGKTEAGRLLQIGYRT